MQALKPTNTKQRHVAHPKSVLVGYHGLTEEQVKNIEDLILGGATTNSIVLTIKNEWGGCKDVGRSAVLQKITHYKDEVLGKSIIKAHDLLKPETRQDLRLKLHTELNVMQEIEQLIIVQKTRLYRCIDEENRGTDVAALIAGVKPKDLLMRKDYMRKDVSSGIRLLSEMLDKLANIQMGLGVMKKAPIEIRGHLSVSNLDREKFGGLLSNTTQQAQATMKTLNSIQPIPQTIENGEES